MKHIVLALALLATTATVTTAGAQNKTRTTPGKSNKQAAPASAPQQPSGKKKPVFFDFTGDNIDGDRIRPDGTTIFGLRSARHGSLIRLRGDFLREIVKSGERL